MFKLPSLKLDRTMRNNIEWITPVIVLVISLVGIIAILNAMATPFTGAESGTDDILEKLDFTYAKRQAMWLAVGVFLMIVMNVIDYHVLGNFTISMIIGVISIGILLFILVAGHSSGGTTGWIGLMENAIGIQPSEFAKLSFILLESVFMSRIENTKDIKQYLIPLAIFCAFFGLVLLQNDIGTALTYVVIFVGIAFASGIQYRYIAAFALIGAVFCVIAWFFIMNDAQQSRILTFINPEADPWGEGYHITQSKIAIGSGGLTGKGLFREGTLSQLDYLPAKHTDFIFAVTAESFGFLGAVVVIILYGLLMYRMLYLSSKAKDKLGTLLIIGVFSMFVFHIFENIGMTIGLMPITGVPLPFMSYGGSSFITNSIAIGLVMSVAMRRGKSIYAA